MSGDEGAHLPTPSTWAGTWLRGAHALRTGLPAGYLRPGVLRELADDLLEMHEATDVTLDGWVAAREFVEAYHGPITETGA